MTGLAGQLYAVELYAYKCLLPVDMHTRFQPGQVVRIKATCNHSTGVFDVTEAVEVKNEKHSVLVDRSTNEVAVSHFWTLVKQIRHVRAS